MTKASDHYIYLLGDEQIDVYWEKIAEVLAEVPGFYEFYTPEWAFDQAKKGLLQVWALSDGQIRGIVLTTIKVYPKQNVFEVMAMCGFTMMEYLEELDDVFERIAADQGCQTISGVLRPGLARTLRKHKAEVKMMVVSRPVVAKKDNG